MLGMFTDEANSLMVRAVDVVVSEVILDRSRLDDLTFAEEGFDEFSPLIRYFDDDAILEAVLATARRIREAEGLVVDLSEAHDTAVREAVAAKFERGVRAVLP